MRSGMWRLLLATLPLPLLATAQLAMAQVARPQAAGRRALSPFVSLDLGAAIPLATCLECGDWYGGLGAGGTFGLGVTVASRFWVSGEFTGMGGIIFADSDAASYQTINLRGLLVRGLMGRIGYGTGTFEANHMKVVRASRAIVAGIEWFKDTGRTEGGWFLEFCETRRGAPQYQLGRTVHYHMRVLRGGAVVRLHFID